MRLSTEWFQSSGQMRVPPDLPGSGPQGPSGAAQYSQGQEEVDPLVLPGEEASAAEVSDDHGQQVLPGRGEDSQRAGTPGTGKVCVAQGLVEGSREH